MAARALDQLGVHLEAARRMIAETIGQAGTPPAGSPPFTPRAKKVLELSLREALQLGHNYIGTEHMLLGLVREGEGVATQVLVALGADLARVRQEVVRLISGYQGEESIGARPVSASSSQSVGIRVRGQAEVVQCSFCGRRPPESGQIVAGHDTAYICEHCVREWAGRVGERTDQGERAASVGDVAHFYEHESTRPERVSALDLELADDPGDRSSTRVKITGVPDDPGVVAHLFRLLADNGVDFTRIVSESSETGTVDISFTVSKEAQPAFMAAYSAFHDQLSGPDEVP